jgi:hypothetical protein
MSTGLNTAQKRRRYEDTSEQIRRRLKKDRQMTVISMRIPENVIEDLKEIAPSLGFSVYQPLIHWPRPKNCRTPVRRPVRYKPGQLGRVLSRPDG